MIYRTIGFLLNFLIVVGATVVCPALAAASSSYRELGPSFEIQVIYGQLSSQTHEASTSLEQVTPQPAAEIKQLTLGDVLTLYDDRFLLPTEEALKVVAPNTDLNIVITVEVAERRARLYIPNVLEMYQTLGTHQPRIGTVFPCPTAYSDANMPGRELPSLVVVATVVRDRPAMLIQAIDKWRLQMSTGDRSILVIALNSEITAEQLVTFVSLLK